VVQHLAVFVLPLILEVQANPCAKLVCACLGLGLQSNPCTYNACNNQHFMLFLHIFHLLAKLCVVLVVVS